MAEIDLIKISELPATSTIGDADELAVVQGGATKKVPYSALKAGAEVTPDTTLSEAGVPADAAAVGAALALKANQAAVTQALAAKADKTEVTDISGDIAELASVVETKADQTALNQKADKTTTDALRQDLTTLNGIVNQKADKTELNTQIGNVTAELATKANTADVNNLLAAKANVASPVFTGRPQAPTAPKGTATLQLATTAFVQNAIDDKQDTLTFDAAPTQGSTNPVTSGGVYAALEDAKEDAETAIGEVREESEEATAEAREIALKAFATPTASGQLITLSDGADDIPAKKLTLSLAPHQSGSGDPSPDNVRAISGYQSVTVTRAGRNILDPSLLTTFGTTYVSTADYATRGTIAVKPNTQFTLSFASQVGDGRVYQYDASGAMISTLSFTQRTYTFTTAENCASIGFRYKFSESEATLDEAQAQMEVGNTATDFAPYQGETYDIALPTAAGTVYGGSLTVNDDGSGTLTVDRLKISAASLNWTQSAQVSCRFVAYVSPRSAGSGSPVVCSVLPSLDAYPASTVTGIYMNTATQIIANVPDITTLEDWNAMITAKQPEIVYQTENATTYTLTASQVTTLLGDNTLWMDADGSIDLVYRADTEKYVERRIAEVQALVLENNG